MPRKHWQSRDESSRRAMKTEFIHLAFGSLSLSLSAPSARYHRDRSCA